MSFNWQSFAESPNPPRAGKIEGRAAYSYYFTDTNYASSGASSLVGDGSLTSMTGDFSAIYDWRPDWRFYAGLNVAWVESDDGNFTRNNSGVNEVYLGVQKWYEMGPFDVAPQGDFIYPMWRVDDSSDEALMGEGAMRMRGGSWIFWPKGSYKPFGYLGFEYRDGGRSFLLPYGAGIKFKLPQIWIQAEYRGSESVVDDADTENEAIREHYLNTVNAGSMRFYSINPSSSEVALEGGTQFGSFGVFAGFSITVAGNNAADGWSGYGGLSWSPPLARASKHDDGFSPRRDRYDETLFEESESTVPQFVEDPNFQEPAPKPVEEEAAEPPPPPPPPSRRQRPPPAAVESKPVDIQLQLRRVPPKKRVKRPPPKPKRDKKMEKMMNEAEKALENAD